MTLDMLCSYFCLAEQKTNILREEIQRRVDSPLSSLMCYTTIFCTLQGKVCSPHLESLRRSRLASVLRLQPTLLNYSTWCRFIHAHDEPKALFSNVRPLKQSHDCLRSAIPGLLWSEMKTSSNYVIAGGCVASCFAPWLSVENQISDIDVFILAKRQVTPGMPARILQERTTQRQLLENLKEWEETVATLSGKRKRILLQCECKSVMRTNNPVMIISYKHT